MSIRRSPRWSYWRSRIAHECDHLAASLGGSRDAVALREIAAARRVQRVEFRPLLVDGGLGVSRNGFVMFVKCNPEDAQDYDLMFKSSGGCDLPERARFTIAHEIIHTMFYDLSSTKPKPLLEASTEKELDSLEYACNYGANRLLLPKSRFESLLSSDRFSTASKVIDVSRAFRVSLDVLLIRLERTKVWSGGSGFVALVNTFSGSPVIERVAVERRAERLFQEARQGGDLRSVLSDSTLSVLGGRSERTLFSIECRSNRVQECAATCSPVNDSATRYVTVCHLLGEPKKATTRRGASSDLSANL